MEPINCTAHVEKERCRVWVPTQGQTMAQLTASKITGLPVEKVEVMTLPAGGGWQSPLPQGRAGGVAVTACFESFAAHMAEVSVDKKTGIKVHKMACAIDCGTAVYPDAVRAQAEAGVVMGMSVAFYEQVRFENGGVKTANYDSYPLLTLAEVPEIEVYIAQNNLKAGGVGEPVFPSVAPAVANAVFKATGVRLRELPFNQALLAG